MTIDDAHTVIAALVPDLMDQSRIRSGLGEAVTFIRKIDAIGELDPPPDTVVVDLRRPGVIEACAGIGAHVIGFGPHVDDDLLAAATDAGIDEVLPRSVFFSRVQRGTLA